MSFYLPPNPPMIPEAYKDVAFPRLSPTPPTMSDKCLVTLQDTKLIAKAAVGPSAEVLDFTVTKYSSEKLGFLGSHRHLKILVKEDHAEGSEREVNCFVKALPLDSPLQLLYAQESRTFEKEAAFFTKISPLMTADSTGPTWCPRCYLVKDNALIFEDLGVQGFKMRDKLFDEVVIKSGLSALASLHSSSLRAEKRMGKLFKDIFPEDLYEVAFVKSGEKRRKWFLAGVNVAIRVAEDMSLDPSKLPETFDRIFEAMETSKSKINVISHGDLWGNNLLFNDEEPPECKLVDFQLFRYSPVGHDLAQFLYLCASRELRDSRKEELLRYYWDQLLERVGDDVEARNVPTLEEVLQGYEEQRIAACCTAAIYFPTVLLDGTIGAEIMDRGESYEQYYFEDRREVVMGIMKRDAVYGERIRETVRELVEMSFKVEEFPVPC
ncbi:uncharacterized protein LOC107040936 [Diachasma alloeum]|uniref:uncharacterized protein LOC107040936 n=1 Tax=Diachasma alloeum TaxID=454923 RepID=UPI0007382B03|nr:uncharacterized protein LOC107040936 [Diachasma alloeum]